MRLGFIGLGTMGGPFATKLQRARFVIEETREDVAAVLAADPTNRPK